MMKKRGFGGWWVGGSIVAASGFFFKHTHTHTLKTRELRETNYIRVARWWWQCWKCLIKLIKHREVPKQVGGEHINVYTLLRRCPAAVDRISPDRATWNAITARRLGEDAAVKSISRRPFRVHKTRAWVARAGILKRCIIMIVCVCLKGMWLRLRPPAACCDVILAIKRIQLASCICAGTVQHIHD